jgi:hypothetical protein
MKTKLFIFLFLAGNIIPTLLFGQFIQQGPKIVGTGGLGTPEQGTSVAISSDGNTAIVGGWDDDSHYGAVWIFTRSGDTWTQQGPKLIGTGAVGFSSSQGTSVAISSDGNTAIEGGYGDNNYAGAVWVFTRSAGVWTQQGSKLVGTGGIGQSQQGNSVAISSDGNTVIEGGNFDNNYAGAIWVFTRSGSVWTQQGSKLVGTGVAGSPGHGSSVAISSDGNTFMEGGSNDNFGVGAVWVFTRSGGVWTQQGSKLVGTGSVGISSQGISVALSSDGNTAIIGGAHDNSLAGAIWVFTRSGGVWTQQGQKLVGTGGAGTPHQGISVAISADGNTAVDGGNWDNSLIGAVWVFTRSGGVWTQQGQKLVGTGGEGQPYQGTSLAISTNGGTIIAGGPQDGGAGAVWVFVNPSIGIKPISSEIPKDYSLSQNYPNPFNPTTKFKFQISKLSDTKITVFDVLGREVETLVNQQLQPGTYEVDWNASNFSSGVYFYKLETNRFSNVKKMVLVK